jgi:hypothetical protein
MNDRLLMSYSDVGAALGLSACRVRQIEQRALAKLRKSFQRLGVSEYRGTSLRDVSQGGGVVSFSGGDSDS